MCPCATCMLLWTSLQVLCAMGFILHAYMQEVLAISSLCPLHGAKCSPINNCSCSLCPAGLQSRLGNALRVVCSFGSRFAPFAVARFKGVEKLLGVMEDMVFS